MKENVKAGQTVTCIKTVILESHDPSINGKNSFTKGFKYKSEADGHLTDDMGDNEHMVADDDNGHWFEDHFTPPIDSEVTTHTLYYEGQLSKVQRAVGSEYGVNVKFTSDFGDTNYLKLNDESASAIVEFLSNNFTLTLK